MASDDEVIEIPIELAQEYVTAALGFAPLQLSDDSNFFGRINSQFTTFSQIISVLLLINLPKPCMIK